MPIRAAIWKVGKEPQQLSESMLATEQLLEEMIVANPRILSDDWLLIGKQEQTGLGGRIDLLAVAPDGAIILVELKRDKTPRDVVAQALDYASWVEKLKPEEIAAIYGRFTSGGNLADDFQKRFGIALEDDSLNQSHQIVIVAASLDESSERIVGYLSERGISINVLFFQVFANGNEKLLSRAWLLDPVRTQINAASSPDGTREPWNGEFYASFGQGESRSWDDAVKFGFISAGGGLWYSKTLNLLNVGDRIWVNVPGYGYVGVGKVLGNVQSTSSFKVRTPKGEVSILEAAKGGNYHALSIDDPEDCEYFVPIEWLQTVPLNEAVKEIGLFGNQNTICRPTTPKWRTTVERLKERFPAYNKSSVTDLL